MTGERTREETILCVPSTLALLGDVRGFWAVSREELAELLDPSHAWFGPRRVLEDNPAFRQLIPYVVVAHGTSVAYYRRGAKGQETRLRGLLSVGFGGHVSLRDVVLTELGLDVAGTLERAARRELSEEIRSAPVLRKTTIGLLCDSATAVSRVHLGIVELWRIETAEVTTNESEIHDCGFADVGALRARADEMEDWSKRC
jgi:predicted NUDIX family phosphoesterase